MSQAKYGEILLAHGGGQWYDWLSEVIQSEFF